MQGQGTPLTALLEKRNSALKFFASRMQKAIQAMLFRGWAHYVQETKERSELVKARDSLRFENDVLRVDVTPLWGGRIHRALHKPSGRYLAYYNEDHTSVNDGTLRSCDLARRLLPRG